ncbi:FxLYD domain-containing protein [Rubrivirga sp.]|uniref:FxLYD domain-containing protein n=1 Tax=Rubrivirga sp. TaxID=1885344 RepID=UPI003B51C5C5
MPRLLLAVLVVALAACGGETSQIDVADLRLQREGGDYPTLTGVVVNRGAEAISSADVFVTLYDDQNRVLDDVLVQVRRVAAGDSSRFEQQLDLRASAAKLKYVGVN